MIRANGRLLKVARCTPLPRVGQLDISIEDDANPEFWLTISIPETDLLALLASVHRQTHGGNAETIRDVKPFDGSY